MMIPDDNRAAGRFDLDGDFGIGADRLALEGDEEDRFLKGGCVLRIYNRHGACTWLLTRDQAAGLMEDLQGILGVKR